MSDSVRAVAAPGESQLAPSGGTSERPGWARSDEWDARLLFDLEPGLADSIVPRLAAAVRRGAASDSSRAESLRFVEWQQGRDVLRVRYRTRDRAGELLVWAVAERDTLPGLGLGARRVAKVFDHSVNLRLAEKPALP